MKTGINMTSVNKIKELAEAKEFWEALDIVEEQDLEKSYNPQFLRVCGEIYLENGRYEESRKALVKAHIMAPEGNRIIYELVRLYLHMGFFNKAEAYFEQYKHNAIADDMGVVQLEYMIKKARRCDVKDLLSVLLPYSDEELEDKWVFEIALLYELAGRHDKAVEECDRIIDLFKNTKYSQLAQDLKNDIFDVHTSFYRFPELEELEPDELSDLDKQEKNQLDKDYDRIHPKDPVIISMEDDDDDESKKLSKKKFSLFKKKETENSELENVVVDENHASPESIEEVTEEILEEVNEEILEEVNEEIPEEVNEEILEEVAEEISEETEASVKAKLEKMAQIVQEEDMELPSYDEISVTSPSELEEKYKDRVIGADGIDEIMLNELPETSMFLKRLMDNQKYIAKELEEKSVYGVPLTDEYIMQLEKELAEELDSLSPILERKMKEFNLSEESVDNEYDIENTEDDEDDSNEMDIEETDDEKVDQMSTNEDKDVEEDKYYEEINNEDEDDYSSVDADTSSAELQEISTEEDIISPDTSIIEDDNTDILEELKHSDEIDSSEIINLYDFEDSIRNKIEQEQILHKKAEDLLISLGVENLDKYDIDAVINARDTIKSIYNLDFNREDAKQYLIIDDNKKRILGILKERR